MGNNTNWNIYAVKSFGNDLLTEKEQRVIEKTSVVLEKLLRFYDSMAKISNSETSTNDQLTDVVVDQNNPEYEDHIQKDHTNEVEDVIIETYSENDGDAVNPQNDVVYEM